MTSAEVARICPDVQGFSEITLGRDNKTEAVLDESKRVVFLAKKLTFGQGLLGRSSQHLALAEVQVPLLGWFSV